MFKQLNALESLFEQSAPVMAIISVLFITTSLIVLYYKRKYSSRSENERIRHQESEKILWNRLRSIESILDQYPEPIIFKNSKGEYSWCNRELEKLWGISRRKILGSTAENLFPNESDEIRKLDTMAQTRAKPLVKERKFTDRDGETRTYELSFHPMNDPVSGGMGILMHFKDISPYRDQLDILNDLYVTVREDLQLRSDYYADFLKTVLPPLNRIIEDSDALLHNDNDRKETREKLERITSSGQGMNSTIRNLSFLAFPEKISTLYEGAQEQSLSETRSLEDWQNQLVLRIGTIPRARGYASFVLLLGDVPESLNTHFSLLNELLERLIENADDHSLGGMYLILKVHRVESHFFTMNITVRNIGPAIDASRREDIFEPFTRIIAEGSGPGLGLTVARSLAEKMGGSLSCDPSCTDGARFLLSLPPVKGEGNVISGYRLGGQPGGDSGSILVADQDRIFRKKIVSQLKRAGYRADQAKEGETVLRLMKENNYSLVLVDDQIPLISGLEIWKLWKKGASPGIGRLCLLTNSFLMDGSYSSDIIPFEDIFEKPLDWDKFLDLLLKL